MKLQLIVKIDSFPSVFIKYSPEKRATVRRLASSKLYSREWKMHACAKLALSSFRWESLAGRERDRICVQNANLRNFTENRESLIYSINKALYKWLYIYKYIYTYIRCFYIKQIIYVYTKETYQIRVTALENVRESCMRVCAFACACAFTASRVVRHDGLYQCENDHSVLVYCARALHTYTCIIVPAETFMCIRIHVCSCATVRPIIRTCKCLRDWQCCGGHVVRVARGSTSNICTTRNKHMWPEQHFLNFRL